MTDTIATFPQNATKPPKTTPADIVRDAESPEQAMALLVAAFPRMPVDELVDLLEEAQREASNDLAAVESETEAMEAIMALAAPVMKGRPGMRLGEALGILAREGNEQAAALVAHFNRPEARLEELLLDRAVAADPYWSKGADGSYHARAGATHQTPEALAAAYIESRGDRIAADVSPDLLEYFGQREIERQVGEDLERRVAAGELERIAGEDGEPVYRPVGGG